MPPGFSVGSKVAFLAYRKGQEFWSRYRAFLLSGAVATGCVFVVRMLGLLQLAELAAFDRGLQLRPQEPSDDRIIIVGFNETDFRSLGTAQITDQVVADVLRRIKAQKPRVIGLDLYRNLATPPGHDQLRQIFKTTPTLIGITKVIENAQGEAITGNPILVEAGRIAASDVIADVDGRVRRGFLYPSTRGDAIEGLGLRVALDYLSAQGIAPDPDAPLLQMQQAVFYPFRSNDGGYLNADAGGYQILLNPRGGTGAFRTIAARDVIAGNVSPDAFRDRIVLVGDMSIGASDSFFTSYSSASGSSPEPISGVELHANIASQIISAVLDQRGLIQVIPESVEWLTIALLAYCSAWISARRLSYLQRIGVTTGLLGGIVLISYGFLLSGWWVSIVPITIGITIAATTTMTLEAQRLSVLSMQDGLTLLANRRLFDEMLEREWHRALHAQGPIGLILCDVDFFKRYNDTYGHAQGDHCLRQVAAAIQRAVKRSMDLAARYGGEEFVVLLPNTSAEEALRVAERIQAEIQALQLDHQGSLVSSIVTLSLGVSSVTPIVGVMPQTLVEVADIGLYEAKQKGRNQAVLKLP